jgi:hypothetical protein
MSKSVKRVVLSVLALTLVVGTLSASAMPRNDPTKKCFALEGGGVECFDTF